MSIEWNTIINNVTVKLIQGRYHLDSTEYPIVLYNLVISVWLSNYLWLVTRNFSIENCPLLQPPILSCSLSIVEHCDACPLYYNVSSVFIPLIHPLHSSHTKPTLDTLLSRYLFRVVPRLCATQTSENVSPFIPSFTCIVKKYFIQE